jgi:hypothetical protein
MIQVCKSTSNNTTTTSSATNDDIDLKMSMK